MLTLSRAALTTCAAAGLVLGAAAPALADPGSQLSPGSDGSNVSVVVVDVSGNGLTYGPGGGSGGSGGRQTVTKSVPTPCFWTSGNGVYTGQRFYDSYFNNGRLQNSGVLGLKLPSDEEIAAHKDEDGHWYWVGQTDAGGLFTLEEQEKCDGELQTANGSGYVFVPAGQAPPPLPPAVIPAAVLAQIARDAMGAPDPEVGRSPGGNSVVGLDTWFWVEDTPGDAADGFVPLVVTATAGDNSATVTAAPNRFSVTFPGGAADCGAAEARLEWRRGLADEAGCTTAPQRSSARADGLSFEATARTSYTVTWQGVEDGNQVPGGPLPGLAAESNFDLAVAEVQSIVTAR
jgi:hypothetical protein